MFKKSRACALAVALEQTVWVLLDDRKTHRYAKTMGIPSIETLGLIIAIHHNNRNQRLPKTNLDLLAQGLWITTDLLKAALQEMTAHH
jgi:predicted nucleic acid-binding protein